jgi:hypothetical protein
MSGVIGPVSVTTVALSDMVTSQDEEHEQGQKTDTEQRPGRSGKGAADEV